MQFRDASWADIDGLRQRIASFPPTSVETIASGFVAALKDTFESVVLARLFVVLPFADLPAAEREFAIKLVGGDDRLTAKTPCLALLGTCGREAAWNDRTQSRGHRVIPLIDRAFVSGAPMLAKLLADLEIDLRPLDAGQPIDVRRMLGSQNGMFYVPDAKTATDGARLIIADRDFVSRYDVHTVFGMGGAYNDDVLAIAIVFTTESIERLVADRYPSLISNFKMATASLVSRGEVFAR